MLLKVTFRYTFDKKVNTFQKIHYTSHELQAMTHYFYCFLFLFITNINYSAVHTVKLNTIESIAKVSLYQYV